MVTCAGANYTYFGVDFDPQIFRLGRWFWILSIRLSMDSCLPDSLPYYPKYVAKIFGYDHPGPDLNLTRLQS